MGSKDELPLNRELLMRYTFAAINAADVDGAVCMTSVTAKAAGGFSLNREAVDG